MASSKKSVVLYCDLIHTIEKMDDQTAGQFFKHYLRYINDLNPTTDNLIVDLTFENVKQNLKRDLTRWEKTKVKRSDAGRESARVRALKKENKKGHNLTNSTHVKSVEQTSTKSTHVKSVKQNQQTSTNVNKRQQTSTNSTVNVNVNVNDIFININKQFKNCILEDKSYLEITAMQTKSNIDTVLIYLDTFEKHLVQTSEAKNTLKEFKTHFTNWLNRQNIKIYIKPKKMRYV